MQPKMVEKATILIREGNARDTSFMLRLIDGKARYASCVAATPLHAALLTRESLMQQEPDIAAKRILAISLRIGVCLRGVIDKRKMYVQLPQAMEQEIGARFVHWRDGPTCHRVPHHKP